MYTRINVTNKNKLLAYRAKEACVNNFDKFNNYGYQGLYNGLNAKQIAKRKNISDDEDILDFMGIEELGGTMPEELPTPEKLIKELEKEELLKITNK